MFSQVPDPKCGQFHLKQLWEDSLRRALFARELVTLFGSKAADDAFAAALLQDMAIPLLCKGAPSLYARLLEARDHGGARLSALEHEVFGWTHAEAAKTDGPAMELARGVGRAGREPLGNRQLDGRRRVPPGRISAWRCRPCCRAGLIHSGWNAELWRIITSGWFLPTAYHS